MMYRSRIAIRASLALTAALGLVSSARGQTKEPTYWDDIRPLFRKHCTVCHSARNLKNTEVSGGLALDSPEAIKKGSSRPVLEVGKSADSILVHLLVTTDAKKRMPLDAAPLPAADIALIRRWIDTGAKEGTRPADVEPVITKSSGPRRRLDVLLSTAAVPPAGMFGKTAPASDRAGLPSRRKAPGDRLLRSGHHLGSGEGRADQGPHQRPGRRQ
jgi:hypothetical protein